MSTTPVDTTDSTDEQQNAPEGQAPEEQREQSQSDDGAQENKGDQERAGDDSANEEEPSGDSEEQSGDGDDDKLADLPEWVRGELTSTRREAAKYRTALRDAEAKLADAKTADEVEAAVAELRTQNASLERELSAARVAHEFKLPKELAEVLKGNTEEELKAHAKVLSRFAGSDQDPEELSGGLNPREAGEGTFDPAAAAHAARKARRYR